MSAFPGSADDIMEDRFVVLAGHPQCPVNEQECSFRQGFCGLQSDPVLQRVAEDGGCPLGIGIVQSLVGRDAKTFQVELVKVMVPVTGTDGDKREGGDGAVVSVPCR